MHEQREEDLTQPTTTATYRALQVGRWLLVFFRTPWFQLLPWVLISLAGSYPLTSILWDFDGAVERATEFLIVPALMVTGILFASVTVVSLHCVLFRFKQLRYLRLFPLSINIIAMLIVFNAPSSTERLHANFHDHLAMRMDVVNLVETGQLLPNISYNDVLIHLPSEYAYLSQGGGDIKVDQRSHSIFFYTNRGILDGYAGFIYRPDETMPTGFEFSSDFGTTEKLAEHWYYVVAS